MRTAEKNPGNVMRMTALMTAAMMLLLTACGPGTMKSLPKDSGSASGTESADTGDSRSSGSASTAEPSTGDRLQQIKAAGKLTVATEPYFAPYEFIDSSKKGQEQYVGSDIRLAQYIADKIGVKLEIVPLEFTAVISSVVEGKTDLAISGLAYTPVRAEAVDLSGGYYFSDDNDGHGLMIREKDKDDIKGPEDLSDKTIVFQAGSLQEALVTDAGIRAGQRKKVSSSNDAYMAVQEGKADCAAVSISSASLYIEANPSSGLYILPDYRFNVPEEYDGNRIGVQKGQKELLELVNSCIDELREDGSMDRWTEEAKDYARSLGVK